MKDFADILMFVTFCRYWNVFHVCVCVCDMPYSLIPVLELLFIIFADVFAEFYRVALYIAS